MKLFKLWSAELSIEHGQGSRTKERGTMDVIKLKHTITTEEGERVFSTHIQCYAYDYSTGVPNICEADYGIDFVRWANHFSANLDKSNTVPSTEHAQLFHGNLSTVTPLNTVWSTVIRCIPVGTSLWLVSIGGGRGRTLGGCTLMMVARTPQSQARHCMYLREYSHVIISGVMWSSVARQHTFIGEIKSSQRFRLIDEIPKQRIFILCYKLTAGTEIWNIVRFQKSNSPSMHREDQCTLLRAAEVYPAS